MSVADTPEAVPLIVSREICQDFERASRLEWLETNHTGAFAMGTVAGVNTRRYHGLLIASLKPPADRYSILSRVEELATMDGVEFALATTQYRGVVHPRGFECLDEFRIDPFPQWRYNCGPGSITKTVCLVDLQQTVLVTYRSTRPCKLKVRLLTSFRDYHSTIHHNNDLRNNLEIAQDRVSFKPYDQLPSLNIFHSGVFEKDSQWFLRHEYLRELERGLDFEEDLFSPGTIEYQVGAEQDVWFLATLDSSARTPNVVSILDVERKRRFASIFERALDQFRIRRYDGTPSLIAGYPWFTDWSRDILISLPAFAPAESKDILQMLISERSEGLLPNRFLDNASQPEYNTADATLWLFIAAKEYLDSTQDLPFLRDSLYPAAREIIDWHRRGTKYGIHVDPVDHLLWAGETNTQLTWMDARVNGSAITPRVGKPVEINALWYNGLRIVAEWAAALGFDEEATSLQAEAGDMLASFRKSFWNEGRKCLFDVVSDKSSDPSVRPNQLFALSLPYPLVEADAARLIVQLVQQRLLTPVGLRTLEPNDPAYRARFQGSMAERDGAYHQGTVWPWLIGPFVTAYLYAYGESETAVVFCRELLKGLEQELVSCCLGSVAEVYDAEAPQRPGGCPAQLWSVAQLVTAVRRVRDFDSVFT